MDDATEEQQSVTYLTTVGLDLAKRVLQVHCVAAAGQVAIRRKLQGAEMASFFAALQPSASAVVQKNLIEQALMRRA